MKLLKNFLAIIGAAFIAMVVFFKLNHSTPGWNREVGADTKFEFNTAYIDLGDGSMTKLEISSWRDFENSDHLQFTTIQGVTYLTSASRVVLTSEK